MVTHYEVSRSIIRRYMADYSKMTSAPKTSKGGWYAYVARDTGKAWIAESISWANALARLIAKHGSLPTCIAEAHARGSEVDVWFLTQPDRFDINSLIEEMDDYDLLASRKAINLDMAGTLFSIRHDRSHAYFLVKNRVDGMDEHAVLSQYLNRLGNIGSLKHTGHANVALQRFVTDNVGDILTRKGFTAKPVAKFSNLNDAADLIADYVMDSRYGICLNRSI